MNLLQGVTALLAAFSDDPQGQRLLRLDFPQGDGPDKLLLANAIVADEALSCDFNFQVEVLSDDALIPLKAVIGKMVTISLVRDDGTLRYFNGYVFEFRFVKTDGGFAFYQMVLKPWLAFLRLRSDCKVFQNLNLPELLDQTFENYLQRDYEYRLIEATPELTMAVQYNESDHNHLHRRLEAAGLYYWYEHREDGHTLCIGDDSTQAESIAGSGEISYQSQAGSREQDGIGQWRPVRLASSGSVTVNSYDFKQSRSERMARPSLNEQGAIEAYEVYLDAGVYGFRNDDDGEALAHRRMDVIDARGQDFSADSNERAVQPGRSFTMTGHFSGGCTACDGDAPGSDKAGREYLILSVRHVASNNYHDGQGTVSQYDNSFTCLRKTIRWRPTLGLHSKDTRIYGVQTAIVVGPKGEEIYTDEYGRVRVQFHWDRVGEFDEKSSPWVRVMSSAAGSGFGQISVPRIGQEVVVQFLDGNCDRPLIIGSVYNSANMPPWELPANKTQSGLATRSSIGGTSDHANALRFEDLKGAEEVWLHAEKDQRIEVEHDESHSVGNDRKKTVGHDETVEVKHDRAETVGNDEKITIHHNRTERVDHDEHVDIGGNRIEHVGGREQVVIKMTKSERVVLAKEETIGLGKTLEIGGDYGVAVGAAMLTVVGQSQLEKVGRDKKTEVGQSYLVVAAESFEVKVGSASLKMTASGAITISGTSIDIGASGPVHINGKDVDIN
ncbi:type VI secretion system tip protein VgrG [Rugamonas sp. FT107W]|uniref:Type VI secretion system tip protein VgrG n=1 Tax=Duganella vulcania TaxID=2692166 RepID=A0A845HMS0_9BURK|nr:type VI secretion system tip protein TssI/VgrG [Duganella vulcania]MYN20058.1 type VI secretion system tip protein VgrG [Duganella vulcania]